MARDFNEEFKQTLTGEELQSGYEEILKALDPETPEAEKLVWANQHNSLYALIRFALQQRNEGGTRWKKAEEQLVKDCAGRGMSWDKIAEELQRRFGISRKPGAVVVRFKRKIKTTRKTTRRGKDEVDWLIAERRQRGGGRSKQQKSIAQMATELEQKFGFSRDVASIDHKVCYLKKKKLVE